MKIVRLVTQTDPSEQLTALARYCTAHADCNVVACTCTASGNGADRHVVMRKLAPGQPLRRRSRSRATTTRRRR